MKRIFIYFYAATAFLLFFNCGKKVISVAGDACTVPLAQKLADAYTQKTGIQFDIEASGCATGIYKGANGDVDIGVSTHEVNPKALPEGTNVQIIAKAPTVIIVNKKNPINNLTLQQVRDIMTGKVENWKKVGGKDLPIKNVFLQPCTTEIFSKKTSAPLGENLNNLTPENPHNTVEDTNNTVKDNEGAIGLQIYGYEGSEVKIVTIDNELPTEASFPLKYGYYQDYSVITKGRPEGRVKDFLDFIYSEEGQNIVSSLKHIRVDK